jgi:hypothetical protein
LADFHGVLDGRAGAAQFFHHRLEIAFEKEHARFGVADDSGELADGQADVEGHDYGAGQ